MAIVIMVLEASKPSIKSDGFDIGSCDSLKKKLSLGLYGHKENGDITPSPSPSIRHPSCGDRLKPCLRHGGKYHEAHGTC